MVSSITFAGTHRLLDRANTKQNRRMLTQEWDAEVRLQQGLLERLERKTTGTDHPFTTESNLGRRSSLIQPGDRAFFLIRDEEGELISRTIIQVIAEGELLGIEKKTEGGFASALDPLLQQAYESTVQKANQKFEKEGSPLRAKYEFIA